MLTPRAMKPAIKKRVIEFVEFIGFIALFDLNFIGTKEKRRRNARMPYKGMWRRL
jgi:hypothetical protein